MKLEEFKKQVKSIIKDDAYYSEESKEIILDDLCITYFENSGYDDEYCDEIDSSHFLRCIEETYTELTFKEFESMKEEFEDDENNNDIFENCLDKIWNLDNGIKLVKVFF